MSPFDVTKQHLEKDYDFKAMTDDQVLKQTMPVRGSESPKIDISEQDADTYGIAKSFECVCSIEDSVNAQTKKYEPFGTPNPIEPVSGYTPRTNVFPNTKVRANATGTADTNDYVNSKSNAEAKANAEAKSKAKADSTGSGNTRSR